MMFVYIYKKASVITACCLKRAEAWKTGTSNRSLARITQYQTVTERLVEHFVTGHR